MSTYRALTETETAQLHEFAIKNGSHWRDRMYAFWNRGIPVPGFDTLYGLRNSHGVAWLNALKLPPDVRAAAARTDEFNKLSVSQRRCLDLAPFTVTISKEKDNREIFARSEETGAPLPSIQPKTVTALVARGFLCSVMVNSQTVRYERAK